MKILIIEDERLTAADLAKTLVSIDMDISIVGQIHSVEEGIHYFKNPAEIDVIFSDIELSDGLSFEIFDTMQITKPIVFCTAYNQYALDAFRTTSVDYILKPFDRKDIEKALEKINHLRHAFTETDNDNTDKLEKLYSLLHKKFDGQNEIQSKAIILHQGEKIIPLPVDKIAFFYIENEYCFAYEFTGKKHILSQSMETLEQQFSPLFFRTNRQYLINKNAIKEASQHYHRKIQVHLTIPYSETILVGKLKVTSFTNWLTH